MIYPQQLKAGDTIRIIAPAGKIAPEVVEGAIHTLQEWGFRVEKSAHLLDGYGRFSATPEHRLQDLKDALTDESIKAIFCARGGYGAVQLLSEELLKMIALHPKWLIGYSDITLLHAGFSRAGVISLHAPMCSHLAEYPSDESSRMLKRILLGERPFYQIAPHPLNRAGNRRGHLVGGNLAVFSALHGTPYDFDYEGAILFLEDIGESPYKIERMIYSLRLAGIFEKIGGLIVGQFSDCEEDPMMEYTIYENIARLTAEYGFPICFGFPCGHVPQNMPMPEGSIVTLEVSATATVFRI